MDTLYFGIHIIYSHYLAGGRGCIWLGGWLNRWANERVLDSSRTYPLFTLSLSEYAISYLIWHHIEMMEMILFVWFVVFV